MTLQLDRAELTERFRRQAADLTIQIASLLQGGILSAAAFSLIAILQAGDDVLIRSMLWLISVALGFVMFFRLCHRSLLLLHPGAEIVLMLPLLCLVEITLFAILSSGAPGTRAWLYWYIAGTVLFLTGSAANAMNLSSLKQEHYADDAQEIYATLHRNIRRQSFEGVIAAMVTGSFGLVIWNMPPDWQATPWIVAGHLLATISSGVMLIRQDAKEAEMMRTATSVGLSEQGKMRSG